MSDDWWKDAPLAAPNSGSLAPRQTGPRFVATGVADPYKPNEERRKEASDKREEARLELARQEAARQAAKDARDAAKDGGKPQMDPALQAQMQGLQLDNMLTAIDRARGLVKGGTATGIVGQIGQSFWGTASNDLKGALNTVGGNITLEKLKELKEASKTGASGLGALTGREADMLRDSLTGLGREQSNDSLMTSLAQVERHIRTLQALQAGQNPMLPDVRKRFGLIDEVPSGTSGLKVAPAGSTEASAVDPRLTGANDHVTSMIEGGASVDEVRGYLNKLQPGLGDNAKNIDKWVGYIKQHPGKKIPKAVVDRFEKPVNLSDAGILGTGIASQQDMNNTAQNALGAAVIGFGDTLSMGTLDNLAPNPDLARAGMAGVASQQPGATLAGQVLGAAIPGAGVQAAAGRMGAGGLTAAMAGDILPSALYGAGSADDGSRAGGAAAGGLAGIVGGFLGRGAGRMVSGTADPNVGYLANRDVRMTLPQMLGGIPKRIEDRLTGTPVLGDMIQGIRRRGVEDFNRAAFSEALGPVAPTVQTGVTQIGEGGVGQAQDIIGQAYDNALSGSRVDVDPQFVTDMSGALNRARQIPREGADVHGSLNTIVPDYFEPGPPPSLTGENMQPLLRELRDFRSGHRTHPLATRIGNVVEDAEGAIGGMFERQAPEVMPGFNAANAAYANISPVMDAVLAAKNTNGVFMPSQLGTAAVASTKRFAGRNAAARGDRPLFDLQRAGQEVLPSEIPDSGTVGRWMIPGALGVGMGGGAGAGAAADSEDRVEGAQSGGGLGFAVAAGLMSPYLARPALQRLLTAPRTREELIAGEFIRRSRLPGSLAVPLIAGPGE